MPSALLVGEVHHGDRHAVAVVARDQGRHADALGQRRRPRHRAARPSTRGGRVADRRDEGEHVRLLDRHVLRPAIGRRRRQRLERHDAHVDRVSVAARSRRRPATRAVWNSIRSRPWNRAYARPTKRSGIVAAIPELSTALECAGLPTRRQTRSPALASIWAGRAPSKFCVTSSRLSPRARPMRVIDSSSLAARARPRWPAARRTRRRRRAAAAAPAACPRARRRGEDRRRAADGA